MKKFLLLSDIHACDVDPSSSGAPSYVSSHSAAGVGMLDPIVELERLIRASGAKPDYVLCAGDITNRSVPSSLNYAWNKLVQLANNVGARLLATVGNHDIDSRYLANKYDPKGFAMSLDPPLPVDERGSFLEFWAENFTILSENDCNIIILNTAAYHGGGDDAKSEIEHGRISEITIEKIGKRIESLPEHQINIFLCHHHPIKGERGDGNMEKLTRGGDLLIDRLGLSGRQWVIVHGHKHIPELYYGHGGSSSPVIMGCASFSAQVNTDAQNKNPNQVHFLTCDPDLAASEGLSCAGSVESWVWLPGIGWSDSSALVGLPRTAGFGYRGPVEAIALSVEKYLEDKDLEFVAWNRLVIDLPILQLIIPNDFQNLELSLEKKGMRILRDRDGSPSQLGMMT